MTFQIPSIITYVIAWASTIAGIWFLFEKAEDTISKQSRDSLSAWINNFNLGQVTPKWTSHFVTVFDQVFTKYHFSFRCFLRSCVASSVISLIVFLIWKSQHEDIYKYYLENGTFLKAAIGGITGIIIFNWIPDYISLLETRYVLNFMSNSKSIVKIILLLILDFFCHFWNLVWEDSRYSSFWAIFWKVILLFHLLRPWIISHH